MRQPPVGSVSMRKTNRIVVAVFLVNAAAGWARAQTPTSPRDPGTPLPSSSLESLWRDIDCECECECCERIKQLIKNRLKDPRARAQLSGQGSDDFVPRRQRDAARRKARIQHPEGTETMFDRPWPRSGDRWIDAARDHRYREAIRRRRSEARAPELSDEQRDRIDRLRHRRSLERIDLRAALDKQRLELERVLRKGEISEEDLRECIDAIARIHAELEYNRIMTRIETRRVLTGTEREKAKSRGR
jgi:hypothetical protein